MQSQCRTSPHSLLGTMPVCFSLLNKRLSLPSLQAKDLSKMVFRLRYSYMTTTGISLTEASISWTTKRPSLISMELPFIAMEEMCQHNPLLGMLIPISPFTSLSAREHSQMETSSQLWCGIPTLLWSALSETGPALFFFGVWLKMSRVSQISVDAKIAEVSWASTKAMARSQGMLSSTFLVSMAESYNMVLTVLTLRLNPAQLEVLHLSTQIKAEPSFFVMMLTTGLRSLFKRVTGSSITTCLPSVLHLSNGESFHSSLNLKNLSWTDTSDFKISAYQLS